MGRVWVAWIVAFALSGSYSVSAKQTSAQSADVHLFIGAATRNGFVETTKEIQDSIKDVTNKLHNVKGVSLVRRIEDADIALTVVARGVGSQPFGERLSYTETYRGAELTAAPVSLNTWWVSAVLDVPKAGYRKEFLGQYTHPPGMAYYGGAWIASAGDLAKNVKAWLEANRDRLRAGS